MPDTVKVTVYRTTGTPNPNTDTVIGIDNSVFDGANGWSVGTSLWTANRWKVYAIGEDLAGNETTYNSLTINVTSDPLKVSDSVAWTIGELSSSLIGTLGNGGPSS